MAIGFFTGFWAWFLIAMIMAFGTDTVPKTLATHPHLLPVIAPFLLRDLLSGVTPSLSVFRTPWFWGTLAATLAAAAGWLVGKLIER
jgi:hypothetical protein